MTSRYCYFFLFFFYYFTGWSRLLGWGYRAGVYVLWFYVDGTLQVTNFFSTVAVSDPLTALSLTQYAPSRLQLTIYLRWLVSRCTYFKWESTECWLGNVNVLQWFYVEFPINSFHLWILGTLIDEVVCINLWFFVCFSMMSVFAMNLRMNDMGFIIN